MVEEAENICLIGHISPDGDCIGSTLGLQRYINLKYPDKSTTVYLEQKPSVFAYLPRFDEICTDNREDISYDLCIICDVAEAKRVGKFVKYLKNCKKCYLVDHHMTNEGYGTFAYIVPEASSTCEVIYDLMDPAFVDREVASAIYTGLIHDTGVFKYSCTCRRTMEIAADCMEKKIPFGAIIDDTFYAMELKKKQLLGVALQGMKSALGGSFVYTVLDYKTQKEYGCGTPGDTDGFIDVIRTTSGSLAAGFFHELADGRYKISLRSNLDEINVAEIASCYQGGGHRLAAGGMIEKDLDASLLDIIDRIGCQISTMETED